MRRTARAASSSGARRQAASRLRASVRAAFAIAAAFVLPLAVIASARGSEAARVVVLATGAGDPVAARLIDELIAGGVTIEVTADDSDPAGALARSHGARAVVLVEPSRRAVRVWIEGETKVETLSGDPGGDADTAARALALRVVEVLRPHLLPSETPSATASAMPWPPVPVPPPTEVPSSHPTPPPALPPPPSARAVEVPTPPRGDDAWPDSLSIYFAPAMVLQPTTAIAPSAGALWGVTKMVFSWGGVDACALVPVVPGVLTTPAGSVKIATGAIGAGVLLRYPAAPAAFTGWLGAGLAVGFVGYDAEASNAAVRASDGVVAHALPYLRAGFEWRAWSSLGLRLDVLAGLARPRPVLQVAGQADTPLGEPLFGLSLGVITWLP
ncbi:MAG: hypothetical protein U0441_10340 [Polyangiaceae bacterium]